MKTQKLCMIGLLVLGPSIATNAQLINKIENQKAVRAPEAAFTGTAWLTQLTPDKDPLNCNVTDVTFESGSRNNWHKHPGGQIIIVTDGEGYYQEKGKPVQLLKKGDVVISLPDVEHWHGATPEGSFTHTLVMPNTQKGMVIWLQKVTDEEYKSFK